SRAGCPSAAIIDVTGETLLAAIEIDRGDALAGFQQSDRDVEGGGGFARATLLVPQYNDMSRGGLALTCPHQHCSSPLSASSNYTRLRSREMRKRARQIAISPFFIVNRQHRACRACEARVTSKAAITIGSRIDAQPLG